MGSSALPGYAHLTPSLNSVKMCKVRQYTITILMN